MNSYLKYSGLAFQFLAYMLAGYWLGYWLGPYLGGSRDTSAVVGLLLFLVGGLYKIIREVLEELK